MCIVAETMNTPDQIEVCEPLGYLSVYSGRNYEYTKPNRSVRAVKICYIHTVAEVVCVLDQLKCETVHWIMIHIKVIF